MINKNAILKAMSQGGRRSGEAVVSLAAVVDVTDGRAVIQFDGDSQASMKAYRAVKAYIPAVGDRVMLLNGLIIGGWKP